MIALESPSRFALAIRNERFEMSDAGRNDAGRAMRDERCRIRDAGFAIGDDTGYGIRDKGFGIRDSG
jgi:hypothetical protein